MKPENSGKIYRFTMDHGLGYGFAEVYDFTDDRPFDGRYVYVYDRVEGAIRKDYDMADIRSSKIALGPITLYKFPNVKGILSWKYLFQTSDFLITTRPNSKELRGMHNKNNNRAELGDWYKAPYNMQKMPDYVDYEKVRYLETRILNGHSSAVMKFSMKKLLDEGQRVGEYYDLTDLGTKNMFVQLINTYYPLDKTIEFLKEIPG
ncbi:MAG TPA: hypothetical protein VNS58_08545 [Puia sp.]|nr:hypothetical protein [Puia sp.]